MRWGQIQDDKGRRAVCMHEETIYELPAKLSPLLQFYSRYRTNFGNPANAVSILRENGATTLGHGEKTLEYPTFRTTAGPPWKSPLCRTQLPRSAEEMGLEIPKYPTIFTKYPNALIGPNEEIQMPSANETGSTKIDWEVELCLVIGQKMRRVDEKDALAGLLGYTILNDVSVRDWQGRTSEWFQGKNWDSMTPFGPYIVATDELDPTRGLELTCEVDGEVRQHGNTL